MGKRRNSEEIQHPRNAGVEALTFRGRRRGLGRRGPSTRRSCGREGEVGSVRAHGNRISAASERARQRWGSWLGVVCVSLTSSRSGGRRRGGGGAEPANRWRTEAPPWLASTPSGLAQGRVAAALVGIVPGCSSTRQHSKPADHVLWIFRVCLFLFCTDFFLGLLNFLFSATCCCFGS